MRSSVQLSVLGVDVGGTAVKWAVISDGSVRETGSTDTPTSPDTDLVAMIAALVSRLGGTGPVGVALPGPVPWAGLLPFTPNLPGVWRSSTPAHDLAVSTGREVRLLNDAHAFVIGEAAFGALGGVSDAIALTLGTGVGGAVLLDGALHRGVRGRAGEFGHMCVDPDGPPCVCGDNGCLEVFASASAIRAAARLLGAGVSGAGAFLRRDPATPDVSDTAKVWRLT